LVLCNETGFVAGGFEQAIAQPRGVCVGYTKCRGEHARFVLAMLMLRAEAIFSELHDIDDGALRVR
jgi:hypothetical protein